MNPSELEVESVRWELEELIRLYPERRGTTVDGPDSDNDGICVYYTDEGGNVVDGMGRSCSEPPLLVTPVCIIGTWIEMFHPEFKELPDVLSFLVNNHTLGGLPAGRIPFKGEVLALLDNVQSQQDYGGIWENIEL